MTDADDTAILYADGVVDGTGGPARRDAAVRLRGATISVVGPAAQLAPQPGETLAVYDFRGRWIAPGLIDEHTHLSLAFDGRSYEEYALDPDELMVLAGVMNLRRNLAAGVTSVRDNGARNRVGFMIREAVRRGYAPGPRLLVCGRPITCTRGHFWWCNEEADGELEIRRAVRRLVHEGADHIKIMASGGGTRGTIPGRASYGEPELRAAVDEAHELGRLTTAHCRATESMRRALRAKVDLMEHAEFLDPDGTERFDPELAAQLRDAGLFICPTLQASCGYQAIAALLAKQERGELSGDETGELASLQRRAERRLDVFRRMLDAGLADRMVAGSDTGGGVLINDLILMVRGGMTPADVAHAATGRAADAIGLGGEVGRLEAGKVADLIVVDGDPTRDLTALGRVHAVFQGGARAI